MDQYTRYGLDGEILCAIGAALRGQPVDGPVAIPRQLAVAAVEAWSREELDELAASETESQRLAREQAGTLGLIGLAIERQQISTQVEQVLVELHGDLIAEAAAAYKLYQG